MDFKACPKCRSSVGAWRPRCSCGHVFYVDRTAPKAQAAERDDDDDELEELVADLEAKRDGRSRQSVAPPKRVAFREPPRASSSRMQLAEAGAGPSRQRKGLGCVWIGVMLFIGAATIFACNVAPEISPLGWIVVIGVYFLARHLERVETRLSDIQYELERRGPRRPPDDR